MRRPLLAGLLGSALVLVAACGGSSGPAAAPADGPRPASTPAEHVQLTYVDHSRPATDAAGTRNAPERTLQTELYLPEGAGPHPLIVFAHGYNGDPAKFTQLFQQWSDAGFAVLAPRFPVTSTDPAPGVPLSRAGDIAQQPADMTFVLDQLLKGRYADRIDSDRIGVAGLSLGGGTTWGLISDRCCVDRRFKAAAIMDGNQFGFGANNAVPVKIPVIVYHATRDYALSYDGARAAYGKLPAPKYFVSIDEAVHAQPYENDPDPADPMVLKSSLDFFRAYLNDDTAAQRRIVADATVPGVSTAESDTRR